jgi:hypothetical protein
MGVEVELHMRKLVGVLISAAALTTVVIGGSAAMASTTPATVAACTGTVQATYVFVPPAVNAGQGSTATLTLQNCTSTAQTVTGTWSARYTAPGVTGIVPGCVVIDPIQQTANVPASGSVTQTLGYSTFASCSATGLAATVALSQGSTSLGSVTANLVINGTTTTTPPPPPTNCSVHYAKNEWMGGFTANLTVSNTGKATITNWTLAFKFPGDQKITNFWSSVVTQSGQNVTATNAPYNATISAGSSVTFGFQGTWISNDASPTAFTLNGASCTTV